MTLVMEIIRTIREKRMILTDTTIKTLHVRLIHEVQKFFSCFNDAFAIKTI